MVDVRTRRSMKDYGRLMQGIGLLVLGIFFAILVCWLVLSKQDSKLYESDNVVCASQPFSITCYERKPR